jgi:hypothetical protein
MCGVRYSSDEESTDNAVPLAMMQAAHHQIYVIINPQTGVGISMGEHTPRANGKRRRDGEASGNNANITFCFSREEWDAARNTVINNTRLPVGVSAGALNAYHVILVKNRSRLAHEQADLDRRRQTSDLSSERRRGLSSLGSASRSNQGFGRYHPRIPRLSEADTKETTSNLSNSFITIDTAGMLRPKTVEGATSNLAAYLINNQPMPHNPMAPTYQGAL